MCMYSQVHNPSPDTHTHTHTHTHTQMLPEVFWSVLKCQKRPIIRQKRSVIRQKRPMSVHNYTAGSNSVLLL